MKSGVTGSKGWSVGCWDRNPTVGKSCLGGSVSPPRSEKGRDGQEPEDRTSMENMLSMLYPVLGSLELKGGPWGAGREGNFTPPMCLRGISFPIAE